MKKTKQNKVEFDAPLPGTFHGAKVSKLIERYLPIVHINDNGLYRNDGLMVVADKRSMDDKIRKGLQKLFTNLAFIREVDMNFNVVLYLNVELDLRRDSVMHETKEQVTKCKRWI